MTSDNPPNDTRPSVSSGKDRSDGAASGYGHGRRKPWTAPHLMTVSADAFMAAGPVSIQDGSSCFNS